MLTSSIAGIGFTPSRFSAWCSFLSSVVLLFGMLRRFLRALPLPPIRTWLCSWASLSAFIALSENKDSTKTLQGKNIGNRHLESFNNINRKTVQENKKPIKIFDAICTFVLTYSKSAHCLYLCKII